LRGFAAPVLGLPRRIGTVHFKGLADHVLEFAKGRDK
jgi:hypothetical protein